MIKYIFMTEESSMEVALKNILPKISILFTDNRIFRIIPHQGKQDLERSLPTKLRAYKDNKFIQHKFIVVRDKDSGNCSKIKENLNQICINQDRNDVLIRIAIHELESWFLGDLIAIDNAYNTKLAKHQNVKKFRNPDKLANPSQELSKILNMNSKISWSKKISKEMNIDNNKSLSFNYFISGVRRLLGTVTHLG